VSVVDGRTSILQEVQKASLELRAFIGEAVQTLLATSLFRDALPGYLSPDTASQARIGRLSRTLDELSRLAPGS
jgi:flagellar motor switch protein FliM